jgi:hypothetical protein
MIAISTDSGNLDGQTRADDFSKKHTRCKPHSLGAYIPTIRHSTYNISQTM